MATILAPAKINLTLEVLGKRPDGFHEIRSVLQTVDLCDALHFEDSEHVTFECDMPHWSAEESLVSRAVALLREETGCPRGAKIVIEKRIPLLSGLGGDSSDAAAVLRGLNQLWELDLSPEKLVGMAGRLGSDIVFFLHGGTALAAGRGEMITPLPFLAGIWVVLVVPDIPREMGKTGRLYAKINAGHYTDGKITEKLAVAVKGKSEFDTSLMFNTFENVAFDYFQGLKVYKEHIIKLGAPHVHLAGSGPALFTVFKDRSQAEDLYKRLKDQAMEAYLAGTILP
jgi:4-diphosphocytidyl-2-C-methyl-D-erythritol kinase